MSQFKQTSFLLALFAAAASPASGSALFPRDESDYINSVCRPKLAEDADTSSAFVMPPCSAIEFIEGICTPSGTSALQLEAHAQCMCGGSFFSQWVGCQKCQVFHGARSEQAVAHFEAALDIASKALCGSSTPTAVFSELFSSADNVAPYPTAGATTTKDAAPSKTDISLYFTPTGSSWGPGAVTGSASAALGSGAAATTDDSSAPSPTASGTGTNHSSSAAGITTATSKSTSALSTSTTASPGMAAPTGAAMRGMLLAVAGGAMVAAL